MLWIVLSLLTALFTSVADLFRKKAVEEADEYVIAWAFRFACLLFLVPVFLLTGIPVIGKDFWFAFIVSIGTNVVTNIWYIKALKLSDLSLAVPMLNFTPVFLLLFSPLIVGELPGFFGIIGVLLIVLGSYFLNISDKKIGFLEPFKQLLKDKGARLMLLIAFVWSISSAYDKVGIQNSTPIFWVVSTSFFIAVFLFPVMLWKSKNRVQQIKENFKPIVLSGLAIAFVAIFQMIAISLAFVVYVIAIKRTSSLISTFFGWFFFKEKNIKSRLFGAVIMFAGVLLITLF